MRSVVQIQVLLKLVGMAAILFLLASPSYARDVNYQGGEQVIYVKPGEPTQISFPGVIEGGFKSQNSNYSVERQDNYLIIFSKPSLNPDGEAMIVHLDDKRSYALRIKPVTGDLERDGFVNIKDDRTPEVETEEGVKEKPQRRDFAPPTSVSGLMREMILVAEYGKQKGIVGYRRSNRYSGETVLHDGTVEAKVDEIFMGPNYWGYVITVENLLDTSQRLNPATFRIDGTRAVTAQRWELAPRPITEEQSIAKAHKGKIYIVTRSKRR